MSQPYRGSRQAPKSWLLVERIFPRSSRRLIRWTKLLPASRRAALALTEWWMARTAKVQRLTALAVNRYVEDRTASTPLHDGGGLNLRKRDASALWYLRLTEPSTKAQQWHRMFPEDPLGGYPHRSLADARLEAKRLWDLRSDGQILARYVSRPLPADEKPISRRWPLTIAE